MRCGYSFRAPSRWRRQAALQLSEASERRRTPVRRRTGEPPRVLRDVAESRLRCIGWLQSRSTNTPTAVASGVLRGQAALARQACCRATTCVPMALA